jgi:hypothetical protein
MRIACIMQMIFMTLLGFIINIFQSNLSSPWIYLAWYTRYAFANEIKSIKNDLNLNNKPSQNQFLINSLNILHDVQKQPKRFDA